MHDDIAFTSALDLKAQFKDRALSPVEVTRALLERIERVNPPLTAYVTVAADKALEQAAAAERAYAAGGEPGPVMGIPFSIKDLTATKGIRTARGSLLDPDWVPDENAPVVERMLRAGGVLLGKTNTPELGWKGDSGNRVFGPTQNPWRLGRTAGGSSGGAGAAVAAGLGPLAQGSDGAGSIRIPAAFCGVFGFKPSFGLVPQYPPSAVGDLSHLGPITRTVRDAALMLDVIAGADPRDRLSRSGTGGYLAACDGGIAGLRVAWSPDLGHAAIEPDVVTRAEVAARRFAEDLGCHLEQAHPDLPDPWEIVDPMWAGALAAVFAGNLPEVRDRLDSGLLAEVDRAGRFSGVQVAAAHRARNAYYGVWREFMDDYDLILTPTLPCVAFSAGADHPGTVAGRPTSYLGWTPFTYPFNLTGQPAATVPCGFVDGLPVGLQIVGRPRDDGTVLRAAAAFEEAAPWTQFLPPVGATVPGHETPS